MRRLLLASLVLAACTDPAPPAPADVAAGGGLALGADGLGALGAATPFTADAVRQALGDVSVESHDATGALWALRDGLVLAEVYADPGGGIGRIEVTGDVPGPDSLVVGQPFSEAGLGGRACAAGTGVAGGSAVCTADGVELVFAHGWDGPAAELPPDSVLADAFLTRMIWRADG